MKYNTKKGFTLIELLVVISIIGLLASVILSSLNTARSKARDAERIQTLQQIQKALTLYYDDNGSYPVGENMYNAYNLDSTSKLLFISNSWNNLSNDLNKYIKTLPIDPETKNGIPPSFYYYGYGYSYWTDKTGSKYQLMTRLENNSTLSCSKRQYIAKIYYSDFGPTTPNSLCGGIYTNKNKNLYVISGE